jgi:hypothetical protein
VVPDLAVVWELRGKSGIPATCSIHRIDSLHFVIDVTFGPNNEILGEVFQAERDALSYAQFLRQDFVGEGWTEMFRRDE